MEKKYTFLDNKPTGKDLFEGKSQERTAKVLIDILKDGKFQVIGVDGGWGVGKSNLVKIVHSRLKDHKFFIYDVWGHQEDDQRRSLLIELTEFLIEKDKKIFQSDKWRKKLTRLLSKRKEVSTENLPYLSGGFIWSLFMIIYTPTVISFREELSDWLNIDKIYWKVILVLLPLFIVFSIYLGYLVKNWINMLGFWKSFKISFQETFQVYTNKQKKETKVESISEEEPSVRDFQNWMTEIDNDLNNKKVVLVLDNLDRLPKEYILSIWSSIHVFFADKSYNNIKIIIPFDRKHIKNAFLNLNGIQNDMDFANDYINKTFDIVFRVSPPILSSWKDFFGNNWKIAFSEFNHDEYEKVEQAYEILRPIITPREIVSFINSFISQKLLNENIPDRYIAIYLLCEQTILDDPLKAIIELNYLKGLEPMYRGDEEYEKNITALAYQIDPKNALEVIYKKKLTNSLLNEDLDEFVEISKTNVFSRIITSVVSSLSDFRKPIIVLDKIGSYDQISSAKKKAIWQTVFSKVKDIEIEEIEIQEYQLLLMKNLLDLNRRKYLSVLIKFISKESDKFDLGLYIENLDKIENLLVTEKIKLSPFDHIKELQVNYDELKYAIDVTKSKYKKYKLNYDLEEVDNYLSTIKAKDLENVSFFKFLVEAKELDGFRENLYNLLETNKNNLINTLTILNYLKICSKQRLNVSSVLTDSDLYTLVSSISNDDPLEELAALRLMLLSKSSSSYSSAYTKYLNNESNDFHQEVANKVEWYIQIDDLLLGSIKFSNPLVRGVINELLKINPEHRLLDPNMVLENISAICEVNSLESESILKMIDKSKIYDLDLIKLFKFKSDIFLTLKASDSQIAKKALSIIKEKLINYSKEQWEKEFNNIDSHLFKQLKAIDFDAWNTFAVEEFNNLLLRIADKDAVNNPEIISWIIKSMELNDRDLENEFFNLRDRFINNNKMTTEKFRILIEPLIRHGKLLSKSEDVIRTIFKNELLDDQSNIDLMIKHSDFLKGLLNQSESSKTRFREALSARFQNEKVRNLSKTLGFRIKDQNEDENQD